MPTRGSFTIQEEEIFDQKTFLQPEKRGIGMVFQDYALFPHMSVEENILFGLFNMKKADKKKRSKKFLNSLNYKIRKTISTSIKWGPTTTCCNCTCYCSESTFNLLDEPFSNLDAELQVKIRKDLRRILKKANITSIFVTHDENDAHALADRIVKLKDESLNWLASPVTY